MTVAKINPLGVVYRGHMGSERDPYQAVTVCTSCKELHGLRWKYDDLESYPDACDVCGCARGSDSPKRPRKYNIQPHFAAHLPVHRGRLPEVAISISWPWLWAIGELGKDIENRSWTLHNERRVVLHASHAKTLDPRLAECARKAGWLVSVDETDRGQHLRCIREVVGGSPRVQVAQSIGAPVGVLALTAVVRRADGSPSPWALPGQHHWQLHDVRRLPFQAPRKGRLQWWRV